MLAETEVLSNSNNNSTLSGTKLQYFIEIQ